MPHPVSFGPLQEFYNRYQFWTDPKTFLHLLSVKNLSPPGASSLRQIHKRAFVRDEGLQLLVNTPPCGRHKTVSRSSDIDQVFTAIVANNDRIETVYPWRKPTDYELLTLIDS